MSLPFANHPRSRWAAVVFPMHALQPRAFSHFASIFLDAHTLSRPLVPVLRPFARLDSTRRGLSPRCGSISLLATTSATGFPTHRHEQPLTGAILTQHELVNLAKHPSRDVAALSLKGGDEDGEGDEERRVIEDIRSRDIPFSPLLLRRRLIDESDALQIVGYEVRERPGGLGHGEDPEMMMVRAKGELAARTAVQAFVSTDHATLNHGMCGAAVLDGGMELCGCVEGVVPIQPPGVEVEAHVRALQGMPCVVEWKDLDTLLKAGMDDGPDDDADGAGGADDE